MATFVLSFELKHARLRSYQRFYEAIQAYDSVEIKDSFYLIETSLSTNRLFSELEHCLHEDDTLFIAEFVKKPSWTKTLPGTRAWIDARFP